MTRNERGRLIVLAYVLACLLVAAMLCATARAGVTPLADYHKAVVTVGQSVNQSESFAGTGTLICREGGGLVLTVAHIFEGNGAAWVNYNGRRYPASVVAINRDLDVACLRTADPPPDIPVIELAGDDEYAPGGSEVEFIGYGGGQFRHFTASVIGYTERAGANSQCAMNFQSISGDSGGPVLYNGKVVGVQWGYVGWEPNTHSEATACGYIRKVLTQYGVSPCQNGRCWTPQYQPQVRPIQPPQQALQPVPPKPTAPAVAQKPCNCSSDNACKCDPSKACSCDLSKLAQCKCDGKDVSALTERIKQLEATIASHKNCECKSQDDAATRPGLPAYFDIKPRGRK